MDKKKIALGIGMVLAVLAVFTAPAAVAQEYDIYHLVPQNSSCDGSGCTVDVWVMLNVSQSDITDFQAAIIFDPSVINESGINMVEGDSPDWPFWGWDVKTYGNTKYIYSQAMAGNFGPGELQLGKITLKCKSPGKSVLHFGGYSEVGQDMTQVGNFSGVICIGNACDLRDGIFACTETFSKPLPEGWNLISLPLELLPGKESVDEVLGTVYYDAVYRYDASSHNFVDVSGGTMEPGVGYFVHVASPSTWTYNGTPYTQMNVSLAEGLNMIGWINCTKPISEALSSIEGKYWYVARWNATTQEYETYNPVAPPPFNDFDTLEPTTGYWISMKESGWLNVSC